MQGGLSNGGTGHGAPRHFEVTLLLDHLPPAGPFTVVTAWPFYEVPETRVVFGAALILAAADDAERLWDSATVDVDWERRVKPAPVRPRRNIAGNKYPAT